LQASRVISGQAKQKQILESFFDKRADEKQREALQMIFSGKAGGFMAEFAKLV